MDTEMALDKKRIKPIVAQRDDMIGRPSSEATPSNGSSRKERNGNGSGTSGMSGGWKFLVLLAFFGLIGAGGFGLLQYQDLSGKHQALQARFENHVSVVPMSLYLSQGLLCRLKSAAKRIQLKSIGAKSKSFGVSPMILIRAKSKQIKRILPFWWVNVPLWRRP
jgi:hypothetical protein